MQHIDSGLHCEQNKGKEHCVFTGSSLELHESITTLYEYAVFQHLDRSVAKGLANNS